MQFFEAGFASLQLRLFDRQQEAADYLTYGIITHGPSHAALSELPLRFCQIGFPDREYRGFVHRVDLLRVYASLFRKLQAHEEIVIGEATAELLENIKRGKKAS